MSVQSYRAQRDLIPARELEQHLGNWVAFSMDGTRVVASAKDLLTLEKALVGAGENPEEVVLEYLAEEDIVLGGSEFL